MNKNYRYMITLLFCISFFQLIYPVDKILEEKLIYIVIPSYNNAQWYKKNLRSALEQEYTNFHIIYTDDASTDNAGALVQAFVNKHNLHDKVTVICNNVNVGALQNLYTMIHSCPDEAIVITLDGDDWLPDEQVLNRLNKVYSEKNVWLTYGQFQMASGGQKGWASPIPDTIISKNKFRTFLHIPTHLRTFYAWLFKRIKMQDLLYYGHFAPMSWDMSMMFPMIEMAGGRHHCFVDDIMYIYNDRNDISDHFKSRQLQAHMSQIIRKQKKYRRLNSDKTRRLRHTVDVIVFSQDTPENLTQCLTSLRNYVHDITKTIVMYRTNNSDKQKQQYAELQKKYSQYTWFEVKSNRSNFREIVTQTVNTAKSNYILFCKDSRIITHEINLHIVIDQIEDNHAYAFYFALDKSTYDDYQRIMPIINLPNNICAWHFAMGQDMWTRANNFDITLYRKHNSLQNFLTHYFEPHVDGLEFIWGNEGKLDKIGLCYTHPVTQHATQT